MATRVPLTINTTSSTIEELPSGDDLNLTGSNISGVGNITAGNSITANYFVGALYGQANTSVNANYAAYAGNITISAQSNITSLGTLTGLNVSGQSNLGPVSNVKVTGGSANQYLQTDGAGNLTFATVNSDSYQLKPVRVAAIGLLSDLAGLQTIDGVALQEGDRVLVSFQNAGDPMNGHVNNGIYIASSGTWTRANDFTTGATTLMGGVSVVASQGTNMAGVTFICRNTEAITIGSTPIKFVRTTSAGFISIWTSANYPQPANGISSGAVAIGSLAKADLDSVAVGYQATTTGSAAIAYGYGATAADDSAAMGVSSTATYRGIAIGRETKANNYSVSIGFKAGGGGISTKPNTVSIGSFAGFYNQGANSVAIGANAGATVQASNSIILNATGANLDQTTANSFTVKPVRAVTDVTGLKQLYYDPSTGEIVFYNV
jgi:hypothetical protein